ncbi:unnamed protein product [Adineta steineri]|uniref:glutaminyl-peptide cyclotransferase n=1 Tax=Adineta steineri TaxID=433720 RepID=A0A814IYR7_9BILA|nr:unnamed protein product [Adineta steineri]CAF1034282.1 unnamed protein product [Adineta steineri]
MDKTESYLFYYRRRWALLILLIAGVCLFAYSIVPRINFEASKLSATYDFFLPRSLQCSHKNRTRLESGRLHLARSRVIICGMVRDHEMEIPRIRQQIEEITGLFADYVIIIVENDSKDGTRRELIRWAQDKKVAGRIHVIGCGNKANDDRPCNLSLARTAADHPPDQSRIEKMVQLRNIYMKYIEDNTQLPQYEYILVQDFDLVTYTYIDGFLSTGFHLHTDPTIDAICANGVYNHVLFGRKKYVDPYAHKDEQNQNWSVIYNEIWSSFFRLYPCSIDLVPVRSCFSGATFYRYSSMKGKRYHEFRSKVLQPLLIQRVSGTAGAAQAKQHIVSKLRSTNMWNIDLDTFDAMTPDGKVEFTNIIATLNATATRRFVLACHYDSKKLTNFIGATDSAKGNPALQLLFFDGEEAVRSWTSTDSLYGSRHLATKMRNTNVEGQQNINQIDAIDMFVLLDLIGHKNVQFTNFFDGTTGKYYNRLRNIETQLLRSYNNNGYKRPVFSSMVQDSIYQDDHIPFLNYDVPIIHLIPVPFPPTWHRADDNEVNLDFPLITHIRNIMKIFVIEYLHLKQQTC